MADSIPVIAYRFVAETSEALKKNEELKQSVERVGKASFLDLNVSVSKLIGSFSGLLPVVSAASLAGFAMSALQAADAVGDAADRAQLSVQEFGRLQYVASQADVNFEELTKSLKIFRVNLDEAATGGGKVERALNDLGLQAKDLRGLSIESQLQLIADGFKNIDDPSRRAAIAQDIFSKSGQALIPLLIKGGASIKEVADEAERLGLVFDDRAVAGADRFTKAMDRLGQAAKTTVGNALGNLIADVFGTGDQLEDTRARLERLQGIAQAIQSGKVPVTIAGGLLAPTLAGIAILEKQLAELERRAALAKASQNPNSNKSSALPQIEEFSPTVKKLFEEDEIDKQIREGKLQRAQEAAATLLRNEYELNEAVARNSADIGRQITEENKKELDRRHDIEEDGREITRKREEQLQETLTDFRRDGAAAAQTLLTAYGGKYASFAKGILAIEKAHAIAKTIISTKAAAAAALEYYGPTPWGYAAAAAAIAYGVAQVAAIASTAIGGGSASAAGSPHNPVYTAPSASADTVSNSVAGMAAPAETRALTVVVNGNIYSGKETVDFIFNQLRERINEYDSVLINPTSRQARELVPEATT